MEEWRRAQSRPFAAAEAWLAYQWVNPYDETASERDVVLAHVGAMLRNEELHYLRASVEKEMTIKFLDDASPREELGSRPKILPIRSHE